MSSFKVRSRLLNFRLSEEELENLRVACLLRGSRNLSEFARTAVLSSVEAQIDPDTAVRDRLDRMEARLAGLESVLQSLLNQMTLATASANAAGLHPASGLHVQEVTTHA